MQLIYLVILTSCGLATALQDMEFNQEWLNFKENFNKSYTNLWEENNSYLKFKENMRMILEHNKRYEAGDVSYQMGLNSYSDMLAEDIFHLNINISEREKVLSAEAFEPLPSSLLRIPSSMDWRTKGAVTPVKYQSNCGACWAFSTTGALEGHHFIKTKKLISLSEQNLIDCDTKNDGCYGGTMGPAFDYVRKNGGIDTRSSYPYTAKKESCKFNKNNLGATCKGYVTISYGNEKKLMKAVASKGPVAVGIHATSSFQNYKNGVFDDKSCNKNKLNHAVLIVGYGKESGRDYWLVKNAYGIGWGEKGYIKMSRNKKNQCGIASYAVYPKV